MAEPEAQTTGENAIEDIDFAKYRTPEMVAAIADLISIPGKVRDISKWCVFGCIALVLGLAFLLFGKMPWIVMGMVEAYAIPAGAIGGFFLGIAEMVRGSMDNMLRIIDLLLHKTAHIADDYSRMKSGNRKLPPPGELVQAVYSELFYPVVEEVISASIGLLGKPILWFYRFTLDRLVRTVIRKFVPDKYETDAELSQELPQQLSEEETAKLIAENQSRITSGLTWTRAKVSSVGFWLKLLVAFPCYVIFWMVTLVLLIPIIAACYFFALGQQAFTASISQSILSW